MARPESFSILQIVLHWTIAALVLAQFVVNEDMRAAFTARLLGEGATLSGLPAGAAFHIFSGTAILGLTAMRLAVRLVRGAPEAEEGVPQILARAAALTHALFYGLLFVVPLTGAAAWFLGSELAATLHETLRLLFLPAILAHALGALIEHFVLRNDTLRRMLAMTSR